MADRALAKRESCAEKLEGSVRQLRRYIEGGNAIVRIIRQKIHKVDGDREELIASHHVYGEKSATSLADQTMRDYVNPKIDDAVDLVDEAELLIETQTSEKEREIENTNFVAKKNLELITAKQEISSNVEVVRVALNNLTQLVVKEEPAEADVSYAETIMKDIESREQELIKSWHKVRTLLTVPAEVDQVSNEESNLRTEIYETRSKGQLFSSENRPNNDVRAAPNPTTPNSSSKLEKMKPPKFSGKIRDFARFKANYEAIVKPSYGDTVHQIYVLKERCLQDEAYELVKNLNDLESIWERLSDKYGDNIQIVDSVIKDIQNATILKQNPDQGLVDFVGVLEKGVQDLSSINMEAEIANAYTVRLIEQKLPRRVMLKWLEQEQVDSGYERFMKLLKFLKEERKRVEKIINQRPDKEKDYSRDRKKYQVNTLDKRDHQDRDDKPRNTCLLHPNGKHLTRKCEKFREKTLNERCQLVKDLGACKLCLTISHKGESKCPWQEKWDPCGVDGCQTYHSRMLHGCTVQGLMFHMRRNDDESNDEQKTLLLIQSIKSNGKEAVAFWDNGSSISLVAKHYASKQRLRGIKVSYDLVTINNVVHPQETTMYDVPIVDRNGVKHIIKAYEIEEICQDTESVNLKKIVKLFDHLKEDDVARPKQKVELLIGMDYAELHPDKIEKIGGLALYESMFGTGRILGGKHKMINGNRKLSAFAKIVATATVRNIRAYKGVDFFTAESFGVNVPPKCNRCKSCKECKFETQQLSLNEQKELQTIRDNLQLDPVANKWETAYPYKVDPKVLNKDHEDNRGQAIALLVKTENRLLKNPDAARKYCEQFEDFVSRGIFKEITSEEMRMYEGPVRYISHHEVFKEDSASTPVRLVLNTSLRFKGLSLNDILMKGPNSLNNLFEVQLRFRTYTVALVCDLKKMYQSIKTKLKERHLRRVVWRDLKVNEKPRTYGTETVTFGDKPAAAISAVALKETAELYKHIDNNASTKIKEDMYVDDIATGDSSVAKVEILKESIREILSKGGFHVKGFVMSGDTTDEHLALLGTGEVGRVLGVGWDPSTDEFAVKVRINLSKKFKGTRKDKDLSYEDISNIINHILTRRMLLAITNSCYDPYGFLSPITIQLKIELRELYREEFHLGWDDDIPHEKKVIWCSILQLLKEAEKVRFKRCVYNENSIDDPELIIFCDGSPSAMCAVAYARWRLKDDEFDIRLMSAKTRVTPLERMTTPRAEIQAAVLGVRLCKSIIESCGLQFKQPTYLSDSTCTLATLAKESTALNEFFGNRAAEVLSYSKTSQWHHVPSADNIADIGTKMNARVEDIDENSDWQNGPQWLRQDREAWPVKQEVSDTDVPKEALLVKHMCHHVTQNTGVLTVERMLSRTYSFLMRTIARVFNIFENKSFNENKISLVCLEKAEKYCLKESMRQTSIEMKKGNLDPLRPVIDEDGIICLSSRAVKGFKLNYNVDRFPILMAKDPIAYLWMKHVHAEDHSGVTRTVAKSRRKFWIVRAGQLARKVRRSCYRCRTIDKELAGQLMAPLPECRLAVAPVFNVTSLDLFGPLFIRDTVKKRTQMKVWGFIATCAATRAIYLDITESYSTDSILQTIRRFVSVRGCPSEIISDQGSQLVAASKDLTKDWNWSTISDWAVDNKMKWTVVPAEGQHQNGLSESMIKSTKRTIKHMIGGNILTFSELQLAFFEIANVINSRPIGVIPNTDPDSPLPITPNDLLLGRSSNEVPNGPFDTKPSITKRFRFIQELVDNWWSRWYDLVLPSLVSSYKWTHRQRNVKINDICLIRYKGLRSNYRLGRVIEVHPGEDGLVRRVTLQYRLPGEKNFRKVDRAIHGIVVIVPTEEQQ